jgi:hypothetical protein
MHILKLLGRCPEVRRGLCHALVRKDYGLPMVLPAVLPVPVVLA